MPADIQARPLTYQEERGKPSPSRNHGRVQTSLTGEFLREHAALCWAADHADAYVAEFGSQNVGAVAGAIHQALVRNLHVRRVRQVFARDHELDPGGMHSIEWRLTTGRGV